MLLEIIGCTFMTGILGYTYLDKNGTTEASKIQRIATNCKLYVTEDGKKKFMQLLRRKRHPWGVEYVYRIPLGLSFDDFQEKKKYIEDGLNHKRGMADIRLSDLKAIDWKGDIVAQIKKLLAGTKQKQEVLMDYDGTLKIRVYKEPLPTIVPCDESTFANCQGWAVSVGESREQPVYHDFDKIPHMVVAGTTTYGKSVFLKNVITTLIHNKPNDARFILLDLKGGLAFNRFANARQVVTVAKDIDESLEALQAITAELKARQKRFLSQGYENVREAKFKQRDFIIIDEAAELASPGETDKDMKKKKVECEHHIAEIARIGGSLGFRLIFATQYPTADTLPRQVKQNCDARLCFRLQTDTASRVVLDESGAEQLPYGVKGRGIYRTDRKFLVQTPFIENDFIDRTIKPHIVIKPRKEPHHGSAEVGTQGEYTLIIEEA